jgi:hypothetical protein
VTGEENAEYLEDALVSFQDFPRLIKLAVEVISYGQRHPILPKVRA